MTAYDVVIVGGGIAGLTAAAYLSRSGYSVLLCEKEKYSGGLVNSFERDGFIFDGGIRATESVGVLFPMLKQLGIELEFVKNRVTLGIEDTVLNLDSVADISSYMALLETLYPEHRGDVQAIAEQIDRIMKVMHVQYAIDNPFFLDPKTDGKYMLTRVVPWLFRYLFTAGKIEALDEPVVDYLKRFTDHQPLLDVITQHFFQETPASFALSYFYIYLDYHYPLGGTGKLIEKLTGYIRSQGGEIRNGVLVKRVDAEKKVIETDTGESFSYRRLVWAADLKALYRCADISGVQDERVKGAVRARREAIEDKVGNDSVLTLFLGLNLPPSYFAGIASEHFFYTPSRAGESAAGPLPVGKDRGAVERWLKDFFALTTYEIACPVLRDPKLAPAGKTGLVISVLFDYHLTKYIQEQGWYAEFKSYAEACMITALSGTIYPGIEEAIVQQFSATPLTMAQIAGNTDGAITGWSFTNRPVPAESRLMKIFDAIRTPVPGVFKAGQWTFSPAGLPISILTGKLAADTVGKSLRRRHVPDRKTGTKPGV